jgi:enamidase
MPTLGLINIGALATGVLDRPRLEAEAILVTDGRIAAIGATAGTSAARADVVVNCRGTTVIPGLIDSHCHVVLGDFLDSYVLTTPWPPRRWPLPPPSASPVSIRTA